MDDKTINETATMAAEMIISNETHSQNFSLVLKRVERILLNQLKADEFSSLKQLATYFGVAHGFLIGRFVAKKFLPQLRKMMKQSKASEFWFQLDVQKILWGKFLILESQQYQHTGLFVVKLVNVEKGVDFELVPRKFATGSDAREWIKEEVKLEKERERNEKAIDVAASSL